MHCVNIAVDRIVDNPASTPRAHGTAIYSSGSIVEFIAYLSAPYETAYIHPPAGPPGGVHPHHEFLPHDIMQELGLLEISERESRALIKHSHNPKSHSSYTLERIAACREFMTDEIRERVAAHRQHIIDTCF